MVVCLQDLRRGVTWSDNPVAQSIYLRGRSSERGSRERLMVLSRTVTMGVESKDAREINTGGRMHDLTVLFSAMKLG